MEPEGDDPVQFHARTKQPAPKVALPPTAQERVGTRGADMAGKGIVNFTPKKSKELPSKSLSSNGSSPQSVLNLDMFYDDSSDEDHSVPLRVEEIKVDANTEELAESLRLDIDLHRGVADVDHAHGVLLFILLAAVVSNLGLG